MLRISQIIFIIFLLVCSIHCQSPACRDIEIDEHKREFRIDSFPNSILEMATQKLNLKIPRNNEDSIIRIWWVDINHEDTPVVATLNLIQMQLSDIDFATNSYKITWSNRLVKNKKSLQIANAQICKVLSNLNRTQILDSLHYNRFNNIHYLPDYDKSGGAMGDDIKVLQYLYGSEIISIDFSNQISLAGKTHERDVAFVNFLHFLKRNFRINLPAIL